MKRVFIAVMLLVMPFAVLHASKASAEVNLSIGINLPFAGVVISSPPEVEVIPGTYVYFVAGMDEDVFFYHGYWYRPYKGRWYRSADYRRGWVHISLGKMPAAVLGVPADYRRVPPGHDKIPYGQLKKNWKSWEKERHWEKVREARERDDGGGRGHRRHKKHGGW